VVYFRETVAEQVAKVLTGPVTLAGIDSDEITISDFAQKLDTNLVNVAEEIKIHCV
jgi:hypothetical protein